MHRRRFLHLAGASALAGWWGCAGRARRGGARESGAEPGPLRAVAFDLFTIFDPRSVERALEAALPGEGRALAALWRARQFEYAFLRAAAGQYADFRRVTRDALDYALASAGRELAPAARERLVDAYQELDVWPDARAVLGELRAAGLRLAPLANYAPGMLRALLERAGVAALFEQQISTDRARTFKPDPRAYQLGVDAFGLPRAQIAFAAFGGWDAAGASWFGYPTFWVNRLGVTPERLVPEGALSSGPDLRALARWLRPRLQG